MNSAVDKFKAVVHYIIANCNNPHKLGATKLNKILWYSDVYSYRTTGVSITGSEYARRKRGPVPARVLFALDQLKSEKKISVTEPQVRFQARVFESLLPANDETLSEVDKVIISAISEAICDSYTAAEISDLSHDEIWESADDGEPIPIEATLVSVPGNYRAEVQNWADEVISAHV